MNELLKTLEDKIADSGQYSDFTPEAIKQLPEALQTLHKFKLFGDDLLAIPANYMIKGDDDEPEIPFRFLDNEHGLEIFEQEFRQQVPGEFIQFGYLHETSQIVLLNTIRNSIHVFHVADVVDSSMLNYKLRTGKSSFEKFIQALRLQSASCFINPTNASEYDMFEIRENNKVIYGFNYANENGEFGELEHPTEEEAWKSYFELIQKSINKGFKLHFGPKKITDHLK